jgi:hypothetical protein
MTGGLWLSDSPGVNALFSGVTAWCFAYGLYFGSIALLALDYYTRLPGAARTASTDGLPWTELLVSLVVLTILFGSLSFLDAHNGDFALMSDAGGPYPIDIAEVFPAELLPILFTLPALGCLLDGFFGGVDEAVDSLKTALWRTGEIVVNYVMAGTMLVVGLIIAINAFFDSLPLLGLEGPRLVLRNPLILFLLGIGYPLIFGGVGVLLGFVLSDLFGRIQDTVQG